MSRTGAAARASTAGAVEVERAVMDAVARVGDELDFPREHVGLDTSLVSDIGIDSLRFVDLTVSLEDALGIREFPMQDWADRQHDREPTVRFRIRDLVEECMRVLAEQSEPGTPRA